MTYADDMWEIYRLCSRFGSTRDLNQHDEWVSLFTQDGTFEIPRIGPRRGHHDLRILSEELQLPDGVQAKHYVSNINVEIDGDEASGTACFQFFRIVDGVPVLAAIGTYIDRFRRIERTWKFASRVANSENSVNPT
jgi:SnoaL-like domain